METNIHIHPQSNQPGLYLIPYNYYRLNLKTKEELFDGGMNRKVTVTEPFGSQFSLSGLTSKIRKQFNLSETDEIKISPIGEDWYDDIKDSFTSSLTVGITTKDYFIGISYDCYITFNTSLWLEQENRNRFKS